MFEWFEWFEMFEGLSFLNISLRPFDYAQGPVTFQTL